MPNNQESKRHHYAPQFLMDKWVARNSSGHNHLNALYWDFHSSCVRCKSDRGPKSYCHQNQLFTFENPHPQGKDAIESQFFSEIDTKGAEVRDMLLNFEGSITKLSVEQRRDWARLLLSLVARRPEVISKLYRS